MHGVSKEGELVASLRGRTGVALGVVASWAFAPLWVFQGVYLRCTMRRLPPAEDAAQGEVPGVGAPLRVGVVGESTAAGVGVTTHVDGLGGQLGAALGARTGRNVAWLALGRTGARVASVRQHLAPQLRERNFDLVFVVLGVNDSAKLTSRRVFREEVRSLVKELRSTASRVVLSAVPPLGSFRALPQPLRFVMGTRSSSLDRELRRIVEETTIYAPVDFEIADHRMAADRFHPSKEGYRRWAEQLAAAACEAYPDLQAPETRRVTA